MTSVFKHTASLLRVVVCLGISCLAALSLAACTTDAESGNGSRDVQAPASEAPAETERPAVEDAPSGQASSGESEASVGNVRVSAEGLDAVVALEDSETARAFAALLPLELDMRDVNGNEKFARLDRALPAADVAPGRIEAGDVMLYGGDGVVVFYESFDTTYSYTRLGRIDDPDAIASIAEAASVRMTFEAA